MENKIALVSTTVTVNGVSETFAASAETAGDIHRTASGLVNSVRWDADDWLQKKPGDSLTVDPDLVNVNTP